MATNPVKCRSFSAGGNNPVLYRLARTEDTILVINDQTKGQQTIKFASCQAAKNALNNPTKIIS
jgi:hypothetical protein